VVLCGAADGVIYSIFAPAHAFRVAALLDRVEGRPVTEPSCDECEIDEEYDSVEETEEETEDEVDEEPLA
jgi:hypothetical protein